MKRHSKESESAKDLRNSIIGMGKDSLRKNYFPTLKKRVAELERYKALLDQAHDAICLLSPEDGSFIECNLSGQNLVKASIKEIKTIFDFISEDDEKKKLTRWFTESRKADHFISQFEVDTQQGYKTISCTLSHASFENEPLITCLMHDITEQVKLEEELYQSRKMDALGQLSGGIAHDFNNMLAGIIGAAEVVKFSVKENTSGYKMLNLILQSAERASDLTSKLLAFSRKGQIRSTPVNLHEIITETIQILKSSIDKQITITSSLEAEISQVIGDPSQLQNAILNLAINARDAIQGQGTIKINTHQKQVTSNECNSIPFPITEGTYIVVTICDSGCGISKEHLQSIFEPFFTTKEEGKGTGLGLAAVYGTIVDHNGAITVDSIPGEGTTFSILLPVDESEINCAPEIQDVVTGAGRVLLVDDEDIVRTTALFILEDLGYEVTTAINGQEALSIIKNNTFDLLILDMVMPQMSGEECFNRIRQDFPALPIIVASGFPQSKKVEQMLTQGVTAFIQKPYRRAKLSNLINEILNS